MPNNPDIPLDEKSVYSWSILSSTVAAKKTDKSVFLHHGTGIPEEIRYFFSLENLNPGQKRTVYLRHKYERFEASIEKTTHEFPRTRLLWGADFSSLIHTTFSKWFNFFTAGGVGSEDTPFIVFTKMNSNDEYRIEFTESIQTQTNSHSENPQENNRKYWWVNQNQTYSTEYQEGFLWSPQTKNNGRKNPFYDFMLKVEPGDLIFSFCDTKIKAIGIAQSKAFEYDKPFKDAGKNWTREGWKIFVKFREISEKNQIRPSEHFRLLKEYSSKKYSPLDKNGEGCQGIYLTEISQQFGKTVLSLIGEESKKIISELENVSVFNAEEIEKQQIKELDQKYKMGEIPDTVKEQLSKARIGQGKFRSSLIDLEKKCRVTNVSYPEYLRASHIKPWRLSTNKERLDGNNGLLLSPHFDHLFDKGFITFSNEGELIISSKLPKDLIQLWSFSDKTNVGKFRNEQLEYLEFHRRFVFKP